VGTDVGAGVIGQPDDGGRRQTVTRMTDARGYAHLWTAPQLDHLFGEQGRLATWTGILAALARAQAGLGIVPSVSAEAITRLAEDMRAGTSALDVDLIAAETRRTSHSTLGLIAALQRALPESTREHVYYGATVQDLTDTWFGVVLRDVGRLVERDLWAAEGRLVELARAHRGTAMVGRTHGQPGAPITFGLKAAGWADEMRRNLDRLRQGRGRWEVGQLGGAVGALGFFGAEGPELRRRFCAECGLGDPGISWFTSRDRLAEFGAVLAMVCQTLARIGGEVYELSRPEIGELGEGRGADVIGSITMPHKRNPEGSEHLVTLSRLVRAHAGVLLEGMDQAHERDGRGWKAEWVALPEVCELTTTAVGLGRRLLDSLEVHPEAMTRNLTAGGELLASEQVLAGLSRVLGKHAAQSTMAGVMTDGTASAVGLVAAVAAASGRPEPEVRGWATTSALLGAAEMTDAVVRRAELARAGEVVDDC
jgi:adenylosuccinate lyase